MDWGAPHDSSFFLFPVNIDYDDKPKDSSHKSYGRTTRKDIFHHSQKLEQCRREIGTSSGTSEGSRPSGSPVGPAEGLQIFTISRYVSKPKPEFDHYIVVCRTFLLLSEENGERLNLHLSHGITEIFF